jgi:hypothetical protein
MTLVKAIKWIKKTEIILTHFSVIRKYSQPCRSNGLTIIFRKKEDGIQCMDDHNTMGQVIHKHFQSHVGQPLAVNAVSLTTGTQQLCRESFAWQIDYWRNINSTQIHWLSIYNDSNIY